MRLLFDLLPRAAGEDRNVLASRMAAYPGALSTRRHLLEEALDRGTRSRQRQLAEAVRQLRVYAGERCWPAARPSTSKLATTPPSTSGRRVEVEGSFSGKLDGSPGTLSPPTDRP